MIKFIDKPCCLRKVDCEISTNTGRGAPFQQNEVKKPYAEQNIYLFERAHQVNLPKEAVGLVLESVVVTSSAPETIVLTDEIYEGVVSVFREARDLCIEGDENVTDYVTEDDSDHDSNSVVCADSIALSTICTSRGRSIRPPTRLDL